MRYIGGRTYEVAISGQGVYGLPTSKRWLCAAKKESGLNHPTKSGLSAQPRGILGGARVHGYGMIEG